MFKVLIVIFIMGLCSGSFIGCCIERLPRRQSIVYPPSYCPLCKTTLRFFDLIPALSWLALGRKCRYCGQAISARDTVVECLTGGLFVFAYWKIGWQIELVKALVFISFLLLVAFIDYDCQLILNKVMLTMGIGGMIAAPLMASVWLDLVGGFLLGGGLVFAIIKLSRGGMGMGDFWYAAVLGVWLGAQFVFVALLLAFACGALVGMGLLLLKKKKRQDFIPFGPFLSFAAGIAYFYGFELLELYWRFLE